MDISWLTITWLCSPLLIVLVLWLKLIILLHSHCSHSVVSDHSRWPLSAQSSKNPPVYYRPRTKWWTDKINDYMLNTVEYLGAKMIGFSLSFNNLKITTRNSLCFNTDAFIWPTKANKTISISVIVIFNARHQVGLWPSWISHQIKSISPAECWGWIKEPHSLRRSSLWQLYI